jgi:hypothetical protein
MAFPGAVAKPLPPAFLRAMPGQAKKAVITP